MSSKLRYLLSPLVLLALSCILIGCKAGEKPKPLSVDIPTVLEWQENTEFSYSIVAVGETPLQYILSQSADSKLFSLDKDSGVLSSPKVFDYEAPVDADSDGYYELSVIVIDDEDRAIRKDFLVRITNQVGWGIQVDFPAANSNVGGVETSFSIRGQILDEGVRVGSITKNLKVLVNGAEAKLSSSLVGTWTLEVPLVKGKNKFDIELYLGSSVVASTQFSFENSYLPAFSTLVSDGSSVRYALDVSGTALLSLSAENDGLDELLPVDQVVTPQGCEVFNRLELIDRSQIIVLSCLNITTQAQTLILVNREDGSHRVIAGNITMESSTRFYPIADDYLVYRSGSISFGIINLKANETMSINIEDEFGENDFGQFFFVIGMNIYVQLEGSSGFRWAVIDLGEAIKSGATDAVAYLSDIESYKSYGALAGDGLVYMLDNYSFEVIDPVTGLVETRDFGFSQFNSNPLQNAYRIDIEYVGKDYMILRPGGAPELYILELASGELKTLIDRQALTGAWQTAMSQDHNEFVAFNSDTKLLSKIDLREYNLIEQFDLSGNSWDQSYSYGQIDFDFGNNTLYQHRVINWSGVRINDNEVSDPMLVSFDLKTGSNSILLDFFSVSLSFGDSNAGYRMGEVTVTDDPNILWFTMMVFQENGDAVEGVYSYNVSTRVIQPIWQFLNDPSVNPDEPYLSPFSNLLNGVVLTEWNDGYVKVLDKTGKLSEVKASFSPYVMTHDSDIDDARQLIYYDGYYKPDGSDFPDYDTFEMVEYDIRTKTHNVIASKDVGRGPSFGGLSFRLDEERQNLVSTYLGYLIILDTFTGDRVLKSL